MIGQTLSHYRITAALGAGGMGEVYRATDTKLGREVAIKVLPTEVAEDAERLARFEREAQLLAALNHPNVGAIYGLEEADGKPFLVLELVEGEELQERLERGAIPVDEAIEIARQIAEGLEAAHEKGVVHRDLKPANVKLTPDGKVKVLDFGLAKAWGGDPVTGSSSDLSQSPTLAHTGTQAGVILGTAAYMSPEQARGKPVDHRTDVWALGAVLWEMLTGRQLFGGDTVSDIVAAVLTREPDWSALPQGTPASVQRLLRRTLDRDARRRLQSIGEARVVLEDPDAEPAGAAVSPVGTSRYRSFIAAVTVGFVMFLAAWMLKPTPEPQPQPVRKLDLTDIGLDWQASAPPTISPDGTRVVYKSRGRLWVRDLNRLDPVELVGTDDARFFFWSPDSTQIGYVADSRLWKIAAEGGPASALATVPQDFALSGGGAWTADGRIVLSGSASIGLLEIPEQGGEGSTLLELDKENEADFHEISALPDNRGLLFIVHGSGRSDTLALFDGESRKTILTVEGTTLRSPAYSRSGHILFTRAGSNRGLWALPFSLDLLENTGQPFLVSPHGHTPSVSSDGTLAYVRDGLSPDELVWVSRNGHIEPITELQSQWAPRARLSPDASQALLSIGMWGSGDVWSYDLSRSVMTRLTLDESTNHSAIWAADGERIVFTSDRRGPDNDLYSRLADGSDAPRRLTEGPENDSPRTVSPDGRWLLFQRRGRGAVWDIWRLPLTGEGDPEPLLQSRFGERHPALSPDGRWLAYTSDESGREEIYVLSYPDLREKQQVSTGGGTLARWSRDGRELFFSSTRGMTAVGVSPNDELLHPSTPQELFGWGDTRLHGSWDVAPDGRFLMFRRGEGATITLVLNWFEELKAMEGGAED